MVVAVMVENGIRVAIPVAAYTSYSSGKFVGNEIADEVFDLDDDVQAIPLKLSPAEARELEESAMQMLDQLENGSELTEIPATLK